MPTVKGDQFNCIAGACEEQGVIVFSYAKADAYLVGEINATASQTIPGDGGTISLDLKEIPFNAQSIAINVTSTKPAQCRYTIDKRGANFDEMTDFDDNYFPMAGPGIAGWQQAQVLLPGDLARNANHVIYIKCKNACGVSHEPSYDQNTVKFKLGPKPDELPPIIVFIDPASGSMVREDLGFVNASFWLDERGACKFSDKSINFTTNYTGIGGMIPFGDYNDPNSSVVKGGCFNAKCLDRNETCSRCWLLMDLSKGYDNVTFNSTEFNKTKMFHLLVRCNDVAGNVMTEDNIMDYVLMTAPGYSINITKPEKGSSSYEREPDIEVTSDDRNTECRYRIFQKGLHYKDIALTDINSINCASVNWSTMWSIDSAFDIIHRGKHNETLNASNYILCAKCRDTWQIEASDRSDFTVLQDLTEPIVIRMYHDTTAGDYLIVETDENATCVYGTSDSIKCAYNFTDGTATTGTNDTLHAAYWQLNNLYYIKCVDRWNNYPGGKSDANRCTTIINPYEVPPL